MKLVDADVPISDAAARLLVALSQISTCDKSWSAGFVQPMLMNL